MGSSIYIIQRALGISIILLILLPVVLGSVPSIGVVKSGSMEPNVGVGDVILIGDTERFEFEKKNSLNPITTVSRDTDYSEYGGNGDVIIFTANTDDGTKTIIHRAIMKVEEGENWVKHSNPEYLPEKQQTCEKVLTCPAPSDGYITKGDDNKYYDQTVGLSIVSPQDVQGRLIIKLPLPQVVGDFNPLITIISTVIVAGLLSSLIIEGVTIVFDRNSFQ